jgi:hypothetical protein
MFTFAHFYEFFFGGVLATLTGFRELQEDRYSLSELSELKNNLEIR